MIPTTSVAILSELQLVRNPEQVTWRRSAKLLARHPFSGRLLTVLSELRRGK